MAFSALTLTEIAVGKFLTNALMTKIKDNFDALYATSEDPVGLPNGSFEIDTDEDGVPDSWDITLYSGGTCSLETTSPAHGAQAIKFVHPGGAGNGGGYAISDYVAVDGQAILTISGLHWASAAGMKCEVLVKWYTTAKVAISDTTLYSSTANPTSATFSAWYAVPPTTARFAKIQIVGGKSDTDVTGTAYFDGLDTERGPMLTVNAADTYVLASPTGGSTTETSYAEVVKWQCLAGGTLRIVFTINSVGTSYGRIYRNGSAVGTERIGNGTYSQDISGWKPGDLLQIFAHGTGGSTASVGTAYVTGDGVTIPFIEGIIS